MPIAGNRPPASPGQGSGRHPEPSGAVTRAFILRVVVGISIALATTGVALVIVFASDVFLLVFAGILVAILLRGLARLVSRYSLLSMGWALALVALILVAMPPLAAWLFYPRIGHELGELATALPPAVVKFQQRISDVSWLQSVLDRLPSAAALATPRGDVLSKATGLFSTTFGALANVLIVVAVGAYLAINPAQYIHGFVRLFPPTRRARVYAVLGELGTTLARWLGAKFLSMVIIGTLTWAGLALLGLRLGLPLALIAGLLTFIPNIGPLLALVPAVLLALAESPVMALWVTLLYAGIQIVETYLITPYIQKRMVAIPPALTIVAQVLAGVLSGGLGLLLAAPLTAAALVLVRRLYIEDLLGEYETPIASG